MKLTIGVMGRGSGLMEREITNIRLCDTVIIVEGRTGTVGEFSIALRRRAGVLAGSGAFAGLLQTIMEASKKILEHVFSMTTIPWSSSGV